MRGARGLALIGALGLTIAGVWQTLIYSGAPAEGADAWIDFFGNAPLLGKTWGFRIGVLLLLTAPLYALGKSVENGWARAGMAFLLVWLPISLIEAALQTIPIETMRKWAEASPAGMDAAQAAVFALWDGVLEPTRAVNAILGVFAVCLFAASCGGKMPVFGGVILVASVGASVIVGASPIVESSLTIVEGVLIGAFAVGAPKKEENPLLP